MQKFLFSEKNISWLPAENVTETYLSDEMPPLNLCVSVYSIVFKNDSLLMSDLREGQRPARMLDIPGGHIEKGEKPEESVIRETFEETGVRVKVKKLFAYKKVTVTTPKPEKYRYPYPLSYMLFYLCEVVEETPFEGNNDTHGRVWLSPQEFDKSPWYVDNKVLMKEIVKNK